MYIEHCILYNVLLLLHCLQLDKKTTTKSLLIAGTETATQVVVVNFTNILRAAFALIFFGQTNYKP